jgi:septal ring-binding cell division protein DamX
VAEQARQTRHWLATAAPGTHVIQLAAVKEAAQAAVVMGSLNAATPQPVRVLHVLSRGTPAWIILAGEFPDRSTAQAALNKLPAAPAGLDVHQATPFLRTVGKLRSVVLPTG